MNLIEELEAEAVEHFSKGKKLPEFKAGDTLRVEFRWDARPSTLPRRQGRRGRHFDFAQWYPAVVVYDRHGWNEHLLRPAGEFYGEFGTYDVLLVVAKDAADGAAGRRAMSEPTPQPSTRHMLLSTPRS